MEEEAMKYQSWEIKMACGHSFKKKTLLKEMNLGEIE